MKYVVLIYVLFILMFDVHSDGGQLWNVLYYVAQYAFGAAVSIIYLLQYKPPQAIYLLSGAFFLYLIGCELSMLWMSEIEYFYSISGSSPLYVGGLVFMVFGLLLLTFKNHV